MTQIKNISQCNQQTEKKIPKWNEPDNTEQKSMYNFGILTVISVKIQGKP